MEPLEADKDSKTINGSGELLSESAPIDKQRLPLTAGNRFARLTGIVLAQPETER